MEMVPLYDISLEVAQSCVNVVLPSQGREAGRIFQFEFHSRHYFLMFEFAQLHCEAKELDIHFGVLPYIPPSRQLELQVHSAVTTVKFAVNLRLASAKLWSHDSLSLILPERVDVGMKAKEGAAVIKSQQVVRCLSNFL